MTNPIDIEYKSLLTAERDCQRAVADLLSQIPDSWACVRIVFFVSAADDRRYFLTREIIYNEMQHHFGDKMPACAVVAQAPLEGTLLAEVHCFTDRRHAQGLKYMTTAGRQYVTVETDDCKLLYTGALQSDVAEETTSGQAEVAFRWLLSILQAEGMDMTHIVRQWNYIPHITEVCQNEGQRYQQFNNTRSFYYSHVSWPGGYPAATGIGTASGTVTLTVDAAKPKTGRVASVPIDNKLQTAAHAYSGNVLARVKSGVATPKFERARSLSCDGHALIYVSGTASIRGEETIALGDVQGQYRCTVENIMQLVGDARPVHLRVYLKHKSDYNQTKALTDSDFPSVQCIYVVADVCREDLLIEIEAIYKTKQQIRQ